MTDWVLGVDSGGSGLRVAVAPARERPPASRIVTAPPAPTGPDGIDAGAVLAAVLPAARELLAEAAGHAGRVGAVCLGAAGLTGLGADLRGKLPGALRDALGVHRIAVAADAVTAYAGALGQRPGTVVAAGTGLIALGTDLGSWRRADGWGHLLGDAGGGAWIGRLGLEAALRAHDGREGGSAALLAAAEDLFGPVAGLPAQLYSRTDRAAVLASFTPAVARCSARDEVAGGILWAAAREIACAAAAVCPEGAGSGPALTGGLFRLGEPLLGPLRSALAERLPSAVPVPAEGDPLAGALLIASRLTTGSLRLPRESGLLEVF